jgi:hypothetical protein
LHGGEEGGAGVFHQVPPVSDLNGVRTALPGGLPITGASIPRDDGDRRTAGIVDPEALTAAERRQHTGWLRREAENAEILALFKRGVAIKEIMRRTDKSRGSCARWFGVAVPTYSTAG